MTMVCYEYVCYERGLFWVVCYERGLFWVVCYEWSVLNESVLNSCTVCAQVTKISTHWCYLMEIDFAIRLGLKMPYGEIDFHKPVIGNWKITSLINRKRAQTSWGSQLYSLDVIGICKTKHRGSNTVDLERWVETLLLPCWASKVCLIWGRDTCEPSAGKLCW